MLSLNKRLKNGTFYKGVTMKNITGIMLSGAFICFCSLFARSFSDERTQYYEAHVEKKFAIGSWGAGFFSDFFGVINNIEWCERVGKTPVVYWDKKSCYYVDEGYNGKTNAWEYFFEPVSELTYEAGDQITYDYEVPGGSLIGCQFCAHCKDTLSRKKRREINRVLKKYIKLNPVVQKKVDDFYAANMHDKVTIALHLRGTDKVSEVELLSIPETCKLANDCAKKYPNHQFFVCTEDENILTQAKEWLDAKVISYDSQRSLDGKNTHCQGRRSKFNNGQLGEEILIETVLMSRCEMLIHSCSNVSCAATFFNPDLENLLCAAGKKEPLTAS